MSRTQRPRPPGFDRLVKMSMAARLPDPTFMGAEDVKDEVWGLNRFVSESPKIVKGPATTQAALLLLLRDYHTEQATEINTQHEILLKAREKRTKIVDLVKLIIENRYQPDEEREKLLWEKDDTNTDPNPDESERDRIYVQASQAGADPETVKLVTDDLEERSNILEKDYNGLLDSYYQKFTGQSVQSPQPGAGIVQNKREKQVEKRHTAAEIRVKNVEMEERRLMAYRDICEGQMQACMHTEY